MAATGGTPQQPPPSPFSALAAILAVMGLTLTICGVVLWVWGGNADCPEIFVTRDADPTCQIVAGHRMTTGIAVTAAGVGFLLGAMFSSLHRRSLRSYDRRQAREAPSD